MNPAITSAERMDCGVVGIAQRNVWACGQKPRGG